MLIAEELAAFAAARLVPDAVHPAALRAVLDLLTAAAAGQQTSGAVAARAAAQRSWGPGGASVWFTDLRLTGPGAAFANAAAASSVKKDALSEFTSGIVPGL